MYERNNEIIEILKKRENKRDEWFIEMNVTNMSWKLKDRKNKSWKKNLDSISYPFEREYFKVKKNGDY